MRLGMDGHPLLGQRTGIGRYQLNLIDHFFLQGLGGLESLDLLVPLGWRFRRRHRMDLERMISGRYKHRGVRVRGIALPSQVLQLLWRTLARPAVDGWMPGIEVFHGTNFWIPPLKRARGVMTVHDLGFLVRPELHSPVQRAITGKLARSLGRCHRVIVVSESTKRDFLRLFSYPVDRVHVTPLAPDPCFRKIDDLDELQAARTRLALPFRFVLSVGTLEPRKNLTGLIRAFAQAIHRLPHDCDLVLVGAPATACSEIRRVAEELRISHRLRTPGFLSDLDLVRMYNLSCCMVFPSLYEGFGLPVLEAMICGTPVICSNVSALPEVAGTAALLVDPSDTLAVASAIVRVVTEPTLADEYSRRGRTHAEGFSWAQTARLTLNAYRAAMLDE
jgi:glycosyltransferase involved in cell wall biosynthesis